MEEQRDRTNPQTGIEPAANTNEPGDNDAMPASPRSRIQDL